MTGYPSSVLPVVCQQIETRTPDRGGVLGLVERLVAPLFLGRLYAAERR